jgi:hypothetical protein
MELPVPSRDGSIELLWPYENLCDRDFRLLIAWMAAALRPVGPYPWVGPPGHCSPTMKPIAANQRGPD